MTKLEQYSEIQAMVQKDARDIATEVYQEFGTQYGVPSVPYHQHNGTDSPMIPVLNISMFSSITGGANGVITNALDIGQSVNNTNQFNITGSKSVPALNMSVVYGYDVGAGSQFLGGEGVEGQTLLFASPLVHQFWAFLNGGWYGVDLTLTP